MSDYWKVALTDIQDLLKMEVAKKTTTFSCVYIELPQTLISKHEIDLNRIELCERLRRMFPADGSLFPAGDGVRASTPLGGTPLIRHSNISNQFRYPDFPELFEIDEKTDALFQWYRKSYVQETAVPKGKSGRAIPFSRFPKDFQHLSNAAKLVPDSLYQSFLGPEFPLLDSPLDKWIRLLFSTSWKENPDTILRSRDVVYWPFYENDQESLHSYQDWISLSDARRLIIEVKKRNKKAKGKNAMAENETDVHGRVLLPALPNLFSCIDDVFASSIHLISFLCNSDKPPKKSIKDCSEEERKKLIKDAADYAFEHPGATDKALLKYLHDNDSPLQKIHFSRWGPDNQYAKELRNRVDQAREKGYEELQ